MHGCRKDTCFRAIHAGGPFGGETESAARAAHVRLLRVGHRVVLF